MNLNLNLFSSIVSKKWSDWEQWPASVFYLPLIPIWISYCLRSRNWWFFTASNPTLTFGGFEGEGKREMYEQLPPGSYPETVYVEPNMKFEEVEQLMTSSGLTWPVAVKPDVGMKGLLFRKIASTEQLSRFHTQCPVSYMIQEWIDYPLEIGLFYYRMPGQEKGQITGLTQKEPVSIIGDGTATIGELIGRHSGGAKRLLFLKKQHQKVWDQVLAQGMTFQVTLTGNRSSGGRLSNMHDQIDEKLIAVFDEISHYNGAFFFGRYDIKCASLETLRAGKQYVILEFNGAGAAPNHIYHCNMRLGEAYREVLKHWRVLFQISQYNHRNGVPFWSFADGYRFMRKAKAHFKQLYYLDSQI